MISVDSVVVLPKSFATVDKLNPKQFIETYGGYTYLEDIQRDTRRGIFVSTKSYDIIVSENQLILKDDLSVVPAISLTLFDILKTKDGFGFINILKKVGFVDMANLVTSSNLYLANNFYLVGE